MDQTASMIDGRRRGGRPFLTRPSISLLAGGKTPAECMAACMFETVGQA